MDYRKVLATMTALEELMQEMKTIYSVYADKNHFIIEGQKHNATRDQFEIMVSIEKSGVKLYPYKGDPEIIYSPSIINFVQEINKTYFLIETDQI
jgi:hypothetical protein